MLELLSESLHFDGLILNPDGFEVASLLLEILGSPFAASFCMPRTMKELCTTIERFELFSYFGRFSRVLNF